MASESQSVLLNDEIGNASAESVAYLPDNEHGEASNSQIMFPSNEQEEAYESLRLVLGKRQRLTSEFQATVPNKEHGATSIAPITVPSIDGEFASELLTTVSNKSQKKEDTKTSILYPEQEDVPDFHTTDPNQERDRTLMHQTTDPHQAVPCKEHIETKAVLHRVKEADTESQIIVPHKEFQEPSELETSVQDKKTIGDSKYQTTVPLLEQENISEPITSVLNKTPEGFSELFKTVPNKQQEEAPQPLPTTQDNGLEEASKSQTMFLFQEKEDVSEKLTLIPRTERHLWSETKTTIPCKEHDISLEPPTMALYKIQMKTSETLKTAPNKDQEYSSNSEPMVPKKEQESTSESQTNTTYRENEEATEFQTTFPNKEPYEVSENIKMVAYTEQEERLRSFKGRQLIAQHDSHSVVLYQTFSPEIADYSVKNGYLGGPEFYTNRTTWLRLSFLWTMEKSQWATLPGRERVLAIKIDKSAFLEILDSAAVTGTVFQTPPGLIESEAVTLRWTADYGIDGEQLDRLTPLIGLRSYMLKNLNSKYIDTIHDITDFVRKQHTLIRNKEYSIVMVPLEKQFVPERKELCWTIMLHGFYVSPEPDVLHRISEVESLRKRKSSLDVVLFLQGAFNPVHTKHVQIIVECRKWLEKNTQYTVVGAFMGVNSNELVTDKIKERETNDGLVVKLRHRIKLCEIAVLPFNWIHIYDMGSEKSFNKNISATLKRMKLRCKHYFYIFGADRGIKMCHSGIRCVLFVGREGSTDKLKQLYLNTVTKRKLGTSDVYFIPVEMENVNSTEIRQSLKRMSCMDSIDEKREELYQLTYKGWLDKYVADYLIDYEYDLYENIYTK